MHQALDFRVIGISPFRQPDYRLVKALSRAGALGILDSGDDPEAARSSISKLRGDGIGFGLLIRSSAELDPGDIPLGIPLVLPGPHYDKSLCTSWPVIAQVVSVEEAEAALEAGCQGLIAKGDETGDRVGDSSAFILTQQLLGQVDCPVWTQGGIGLNTAAAAIGGGAKGVVLDSQFALMRDFEVPPKLHAALKGMDGSETQVVGGFRVLARAGDDPEALVKSTGRSAESLLRPAISPDALFPMGTDAALAANLADRFVTAGRLVTALNRHVDDALNLANSRNPLLPGSKLAQAQNIEVPVFQGPMTRVSDTPEFAVSVAENGGLPFIALSMMRGPQALDLLKKTSDLIGDQAWGVGILGFVPEELRKEQLNAIEEVRPPVALIAGGRPAQARPLEEAGTATYLHVPSPGLLEMFLEQGARRFVFEGRECGGHVGPRSSFLLWELALAHAERFARPEELSLIFAGGIHDARSAAMIAAMTAPLANKGAHIGILMGTAYLFTREAVDGGAILPRFQQEAVECINTALLETAPGHATRCTQSPYVDFFSNEREQLERNGMDPKEVWAALETMNVGRLRIASKGKKRVGDHLADVEVAEQYQDGMYMIGDVATLRHEVSTMAELHRDVTEGTRAILSEALPKGSRTSSAAPCDIAIVGMSCIFPGAGDLDEYWSNIVKGTNEITEVDPDRWNPEWYYEPESRSGDKLPTKWGGFIPDVVFDPLDYGIPPQSLSSIDPSQLLSLEVARRALEDAGYHDKEFDRSRVSVVFGAEAGSDLPLSYGFRALYPQLGGEIPDSLDKHLPRLTEDSFPGILGNVIAGRIANRLDLGGSNYTVDAACASSLAAIDMSTKELVAGTSDMVLCGGVDLHNSVADYLLFAGVHALSPSGQCKTFDSKADGIVLSEGVACLALKRLADAERDGDRIYAVIKSISGSSDGRSLGLTAPRKEGQMRALERGYTRAGISPAQVGLVEAHGTGTVVGDRTELGTLTEVFSAADAPANSCRLGSVKSQIGHTKCAAGLAGVIKVAKALHHHLLPPTLNIESPNPGYDRTHSPFHFSSEAAPWLEDQPLASVSAFGFGGSNFHTVLSAYDPDATADYAYRDWPQELFLIHGKDDASAIANARKLLNAAGAGTSIRLCDLAFTAASMDAASPVQYAFTSDSPENLKRRLEGITGGKLSKEVHRAGSDDAGKIAFLFPGQGAQRPRMLEEVFVGFPQTHRFLKLGHDWVPSLFPPTPWTEEEANDQRRQITDTRVAQPVLGITGLAVADVLKSLGVKPDMAGGHSYGELVALSVAGSIAEEDLFAISQLRAESILKSAGEDRGAMAAVSADGDSVAKLIEGVEGVVVANLNSPRQTVVSGTSDGIAQLIDACRERDIGVRGLKVACAFHSPVIAGADIRFRQQLQQFDLKAPEIPIWHNATARPYDDDIEGNDLRNRLAAHLTHSVMFADQIDNMYEAGARTFIEVGSGRILSGMVADTLRDRPYTVIATDPSGKDSLTGLLKSLARMATSGIRLKLDNMFSRRGAELIDLSELEQYRAPASAWRINGWLAQPIQGEAPDNRLRRTPTPIITGTQGVVQISGSQRDESVVEYLRNLREIAQAQRDVMLGYLGAPASPPAPAQLEQGTSITASAVTGAADDVIEKHGAPTQDVKHALIRIVSEKTGYPADMLDMELDLEADLSIDSIKRIEIIGALASDMGLALDGASDELIEELASKKTIGEIVTAYQAQYGAAPIKSSETATPEGKEDSIPRTLDANAVTQMLATIVSTKTGYPIEMLDQQLDLEADLSIDSIKRIEIVGELMGNMGLARDALEEQEEIIEKLAAQKTLGDITAVLVQEQTDGHKSESESAPEVSTLPDDTTGRIVAQRYVVVDQAKAIDGSNSVFSSNQTIGLSTAPSALADALNTRLEKLGCSVVSLTDSEESLDGLLFLEAVSGVNGEEPAEKLFDLLRRLDVERIKWVVAVASACGRFNGDCDEQPYFATGVSGLLKSFGKEHPEVATKTIYLRAGSEPATMADAILAELQAAETAPEVWLDKRDRFVPTLRPRELSKEPASGLGLDRDSVVLVTGGGRGITALAVRQMAARYPARFILVGRTPLTDSPDPLESEAQSLANIRQVLAARGELQSPREIESRARALTAAREIRDTLQAVRDTGATANYHSLDVRDAKAFNALVDDLYERYGRIDAVIHGAGIIEDKLAQDKTSDSFRRVYDTKVVPARVLVERLRDDVKYVVFFSSISGAVGNRGQTDYAAAGDVLDQLARQLQRRIDGRVVSIDWGPWAGRGMVSDELAREYATRGIGLIEEQEGISFLLQELAQQQDPQSQVVFVSSDPSLWN